MTRENKLNYERESATLMRDMEEDIFIDLTVCQQQHQQQQHGVAVGEAARILAKEQSSYYVEFAAV